MIKKHLLREAAAALVWTAVSVLMIGACIFGVILRLGVPVMRKIWAGIIALVFLWFAVYQVTLFVKHLREVHEFEKKFLPEKLGNILAEAQEQYHETHFVFGDRIISLEATEQFYFKDVTGTAIVKRAGYRSAFRQKTLVIRLKTGKFVYMRFSAFTKRCEKTKALIDERAGIAQKNKN